MKKITRATRPQVVRARTSKQTKVKTQPIHDDDFTPEEKALLGVRGEIGPAPVRDPVAIDDPENIDPNMVMETPGREYGYLRLEGIPVPVKYDKITLVIEPVGEHFGPLRLPKPFCDVGQPFVPTCTIPVPGVNMGCFTSNGCPFRLYQYLGKFNVIIHREGRITYCSCHEYWHGVNKSKRPVSNIHYKLDEYDLLLDRTTVPVEHAVVNAQGLVVDTEVREVEVPNLGPMYWRLLRAKGLPVPEWSGAVKPVGGLGTPLDTDFRKGIVADYIATHHVKGSDMAKMAQAIAAQRQGRVMRLEVPVVTKR